MVTIGPLVTTRMACGEPAAAQEGALLRVLSDATLEATVDGEALRLAGTTGTVECRAGASVDR